MINFTPRKQLQSQEINIKRVKSSVPSKFTIKVIMGYAAALRVYNTESLGQTSVLLN